jgi:hypothetical protein
MTQNKRAAIFLAVCVSPKDGIKETFRRTSSSRVYTHLVAGMIKNPGRGTEAFAPITWCESLNEAQLALKRCEHKAWYYHCAIWPVSAETGAKSDA